MKKPSKGYALRYRNAELLVEEGICLQPNNCTCYGPNVVNDATKPKCLYTIAELRKKIVDYYESQAYDVSKMTDKQFLETFKKW